MSDLEFSTSTGEPDWTLTKQEVAYIVAVVAAIPATSTSPAIQAAIAKVKANCIIGPNGRINTRMFNIV